MNIIYFLMPLALLLGAAFAASFVAAAARGQYDDLETPPRRMLLEDPLEPNARIAAKPETRTDKGRQK